MKKFRESNCDSLVRNFNTDYFGRKIYLLGRYAHKYSIHIESLSGRVTVETFSNGTEARKRFYNLIRKRL